MPLFMPPPLSSVPSLSSFPHHLHLPFFSGAGGQRRVLRRGDLAIRMGGGPRTFPGGVTKWQWKRMQAKKAKQLLKARLARERQLYEMRKRAELRAAVAQLERPWEPVAPSAAAPNLMSVAADEQLKALADRFHLPGGLDLWNDRDGPQVFASPATGKTSARFFPKNAVHSTQPYGILSAGDGGVAGGEGNGEGRGGLEAVGERAQGVCENAGEKEKIDDGEFEQEWRVRAKPVNDLDVGDDDGERNWTDDGSVSDSEEMSFERQWPARNRGYGRKSGPARWRPANAVNDGDDDGNERDWNGDGFVSDLEDMRDGGLEPQWRERNRGNGRKNGMARWRPANVTNAGDDNANERDWNGDGFVSDSEGARDGGFEPKWQARNRGSGRKNGAGRWKPSSAMNARNDNANASERDWIGGGFISYSEETREGGFEPKWRGRNRENGMRNGTGRWKPLNAMNPGNDDDKDWIGDGFNSESESRRESGFEPKWKGRNRRDQRENGAGRWNPTNGRNAGKEEDGNRVGRYRRHNDGNGRDWAGDGFASDLEEPKWRATQSGGNGRKTGAERRKSANGMNAGSARGDDKFGRFRRGGNGNGRDWSSDGNGAGRWKPANAMGAGGEEDGGKSRRYRRGGNGGRRLKGDGYSLRPTTELYSSWKGENGSNEMD